MDQDSSKQTRRRTKQVDKVDPEAPVWTRHTMASQLGVSLSDIDRKRGDGSIPEPALIGKRNLGWSQADGKAIVAKHFSTSKHLPPGADYDAIWRDWVAAFAVSPEYRTHLPQAEALALAVEIFPQLADVLLATAAHEGLVPKKLAPVAHVVTQFDNGQWGRITGWTEGTVTIYFAHNEAEAHRPRLKGLP